MENNKLELISMDNIQHVLSYSGWEAKTFKLITTYSKYIRGIDITFWFNSESPNEFTYVEGNNLAENGVTYTEIHGFMMDVGLSLGLKQISSR